MTYTYTEFATGTVGGTAEELIGGGANELVVQFTNRGTDTIWVGIDSAVVEDFSGSGDSGPVLPGETVTIVLPNDTNSPKEPSNNSNLWGVTSGASVTYSAVINHNVGA